MATNITTPEHIARLSFGIIKEVCAVNSVSVPRTTPEEIVQLHYAQVRRRVIAKLRPYCAATRVLATLDAAGPAFGGQSAYRLPNDFLSLRFIYEEALPLNEVGYNLEGDHILLEGTNGPTLPIGYCRDLEDVSRFSPHLVEVIAHELALKLALSVAGKPALQNTVSTMLAGAWLAAGAIEAQMNPVRTFTSSRVVNARTSMGGGGRSYPRFAARTA